MSVLRDMRVNNFPLDSFERLRVANPFSQFDSQFQYDAQPIIWEQLTGTGGTVTHVPAECCVTLAATSTTGSFAAMQTYQYFRYFPGRAHEVWMTFILGAPTANTRKRVGYFDASDGIYLQQGVTGVHSIVRRTSAPAATEEIVNQSDWNIDPLDGTGPSGITLDFTKGQIMLIKAQWLGLGRCEIAFDINGKLYPAHAFTAANVATVVYTRTFNLPLRAEVVTVAPGGVAGSMKLVCSSVINSGTPDLETAYHFGVCGLAGTITVTTAAEVPLMAIRPALTFNGIVNRTLVIPEEVMVLCGANPIRVRVLWGAVVSGGGWNATSPGNSAVEFNTGVTGYTGGVPIHTFLMSGTGATRSAETQSLSSRFPITLDAAGTTQRQLVLAAQSSGGNSICVGGMNWREIR